MALIKRPLYYCSIFQLNDLRKAINWHVVTRLAPSKSLILLCLTNIKGRTKVWAIERLLSLTRLKCYRSTHFTSKIQSSLIISKYFWIVFLAINYVPATFRQVFLNNQFLQFTRKRQFNFIFFLHSKEFFEIRVNENWLELTRRKEEWLSILLLRLMIRASTITISPPVI